jgi:ABC-type oligopeptide transport system ATPase subunit
VFRDVSFHYDRSSRAGAGIERLNLTIAPGTFLGVSGPTGAGKTTFADLLIGLLESDSGEITVGGVPLRGAAAIKWRNHVSYVVQDPYLFRDTIRRNLLWANPQASDAEIWDALAIAGVDDFVAGLTAGLRRTRHAHFRRRAPAVVPCPRRAPPAFPIRARRSNKRDRRSGGTENHQGNARSQAAPDHRDDRASRSEPRFLRPHAPPARRQGHSR